MTPQTLTLSTDMSRLLERRRELLRTYDEFSAARRSLSDLTFALDVNARAIADQLLADSAQP